MEKCREAEVRFHGEELKIYGERMTILQKAYNELLVLSNKRVSDLHTLNDFITAAHSELVSTTKNGSYCLSQFYVKSILVNKSNVYNAIHQIVALERFKCIV